MVIIRQFKKEDAAEAAVLTPQLTKNIIEPEKLVERLSRLADFKNWHYLVAEDNGQIVGLAGLAWYPIPSKGLIGWLEEVVVDEKSRGQGIGRSLTAEL